MWEVFVLQFPLACMWNAKARSDRSDLYIVGVEGVAVTFTDRLSMLRLVEDWCCLEQPKRQEPLLLKEMGLHKACLTSLSAHYVG